MRLPLLQTLRLLIACLGGALVGCSSDDSSRPGAESSSTRSMLTADHGLQLQQWRIAEQPETIAEGMARFGEPVELEETQSMLRRNGLRFLRLPLSQVQGLREALGGASMSVDSWYGQAYEWQSIAAAPIRPEPTGIAVNGRIRRFQGGRLEMMFRGWTVPMENGPVMLLELLPRYNQTRQGRLEQMLRRRQFEGEHFTSINVQVLMEPGWAYLLTFESPSVDWSGEGGASRFPPQEDSVALGPDAVAPLTLGEILLREDGPTPHRRVLLFVPRIPPRAYPPEHPAAARVAEDGTGEAF